MVKAMDCGILVIVFVLQSRYYVHFRSNTQPTGGLIKAKELKLSYDVKSNFINDNRYGVRSFIKNAASLRFFIY